MSPLSPSRLVVAVLAPVITGALLTAPAAPGSAAPAGVVAAASWGDLENPVLAASDRGGHVLVAQRPLAGSDQHGPVETASLGPGSRHWSPLRRLSSQTRTVGLAVDVAGPGHGVAAWTAGGNVFARTRTARGGWGSEQKLSLTTGSRWVSVDVNRAGDAVVTWLQSGHVYVAWRRAGGSWQRWYGPASRLHPATALAERPATGPATARVTWLAGTPGSESTGIAIRTIRLDGGPLLGDEAVLLSRPEILGFAWDAGATRMTLATVTRSDPLNAEEASQTTLTAYDGVLGGGGVTERWSERSSYGPIVTANGITTRVTWHHDLLSGNLLDVQAGLYTAVQRQGVWGQRRTVDTDAPDVGFDRVAQASDGNGDGFVGYRIRVFGSPTTGSLAVRRLRDQSAVYFGQMNLVGAAPIAASIGPSGPGVVAWAAGADAHPRVFVRGYTR